MKNILLFSVVTASAAVCAQPINYCPAKHEGVKLDNVQVYAGQPEEKAELIPDSEKSTKKMLTTAWLLSEINDQEIYLVCHYNDKTITEKVGVNVKTCCLKEIRPSKTDTFSCEFN